MVSTCTPALPGQWRNPACLLPGEHSQLGRLGFAIMLIAFLVKTRQRLSFWCLLCSKFLGTKKETQTHAQYAPRPEAFGIQALPGSCKGWPCPDKQVKFPCICLKRNTPQWANLSSGYTNILFPKARPWNTASPHICPAGPRFHRTYLVSGPPAARSSRPAELGPGSRHQQSLHEGLQHPKNHSEAVAAN